MLRVIYASTATADFDEAELVAILEASRRNNSRQGITGALAYHDYTFIQIIEGRQASVEAVFAKIAHDGRHRGVIVLDRSNVEARVFAQWSMGWIWVSDLTRVGFDLNILRLRDTPSPMINAMLKAFRRVVRLDGR